MATMNVADNLQQIQAEIEQACQKSNRKSDEITIIGVTKYVTIERTKEAIQAGISNLGENRMEEFQEKYDELGEAAAWHFIGTLQSRKAKHVIDKVDMIHSLDRMSLAKEINKRAQKTVDCFVQVNVSGENSKHGLAPVDVDTFIEQLAGMDHIRVVGLMTMAPHKDNEEKLREVFRSLANLRDSLREKGYPHAPCEFLSMGMSNDYPIAIEEGATHIRIGSKLVGS